MDQRESSIMAEPKVIVFERRPRWAPELQRQFLGAGVSVRACRSTADMLRSWQAAPGSVLILDLSRAAAECLQFLGKLLGQVPSPTVVVIGSGPTAELEWPIRELGAVAFLSGFVSGETLARVCRRQWTSDERFC